MKKIFSFIIILAILLPCLPIYTNSLRFSGSGQAAAEAPSGNEASQAPYEEASQTVKTYARSSTMPPLKYDFLPASAHWANLASEDEAATFDASYELADNVVKVGGVAGSIASAGQLLSGSAEQKLRPYKIVEQGGYIQKSILDAAVQTQSGSVPAGTVIVDEAAGTAFKVVSPAEYTGFFHADQELGELVSPLKNTYLLEKPKIHEVLKDFRLGSENGQPVSLTRGNIVSFAPNVEKNLATPLGTKTLDAERIFRYLSDDPLAKFIFENERLDAWLGSGLPVSVTITGGLGVDKIGLDAFYTANSGYRVAMSIKEESYIDIRLDADYGDELIIPILGINADIRAGDFDIAHITGGVFVIVGIDGTLRVEIETRQYCTVTAGVRGSTKFYIPTSIHPVYDQDLKNEGDIQLSGRINASLKFGPMINLEVFGFELVGAGAFFGVGVAVQSDMTYLNIELYGILDIYVTFLGKRLNLANYRPTICYKRQSNTGGYLTEFLEVYVYPGRVGGIIKKEPPQKGAAYVAAQDVPYRILVVPKGTAFDPNIPGDADKASVRKYPASGYALTNAEGEFFQEDPTMLYQGDKAYLEFRADGKTYFSDPYEPTLPFDKITILQADYFNDFVVGHVSPVRLINWDAAPDDPPEQQYTLTEYAYGTVTLNPYLSTNFNIHIPFGGQARTVTDQNGFFDTRVLPVSVITGKPIPNAHFDVYENMEDWGDMGGFDYRMDYHGASAGGRIQCHSTASLTVTRLVEEVPNSYVKTENPDGSITDSMLYDESIWIINTEGIRTVTEEELEYAALVFSTQDYYHDWKEASYLDYDFVCKQENLTLTPVLDENGRETGAALLSMRVKVSWLWKAHPNPVIITSENHTQTTSEGGSFQITATGYAPFSYAVDGAPEGVFINADTGLMTFAAGMAPGVYPFTVRVCEDRSLILPVWAPDPYSGNDASSPAEQLFVLTVTGTATGAPVIDAAAHGYHFEMEAGANFAVTVTAQGTAPIVWSLESDNPTHGLPAELTIGSATGELFAAPTLAAGEYTFIIKAANAAGFDTQLCTLDVQPAGLQHGADVYASSQTAVVSQNSTVNPVILDWEHDIDVYTKDRSTVNGARFVRWHARIDMRFQCASPYAAGDIHFMFYDTAPRCNNYHYFDQLPDAVKQKLEQILEGLRSEYAQGALLGKSIDDYGDLWRMGQHYPAHGGCYLEYGSLMDKIAAKKGGKYKVELNELTGTLVPDNYFAGLQGNKSALLTFKQQGASLSFLGKDIKTVSEFGSTDFSFSPEAPNAEMMLDAAGGSGFTYSFAHHGALPGTATFQIETPLARGDKVNVYKYQAETGQFSLIASDVKVGKNGVVVYKNDSMSEYLITTQTIEGALISDAAASQAAARNLYLYLGVGAGVLLAGVALFMILRSRMHGAR